MPRIRPYKSVSRIAPHYAISTINPEEPANEAPEALFRIDDWGNIRHWQEIAEALLRKYAARYYGLCRQCWEVPLYKSIKDIEARLHDGNLRLKSFLVSVTLHEDLDERWHVDGNKLTQAELADRHVLFQHDGGYVADLFRRLGALRPTRDGR